jgi:hypothetical protein
VHSDHNFYNLHNLYNDFKGIVYGIELKESSEHRQKFLGLRTTQSIIFSLYGHNSDHFNSHMLTNRNFISYHMHVSLPQFYEAIETFRKIEDSSERYTVAQSLFDTFIKPGSEKEVNVDYDQRMKIEISLSEASKTTFDVAQSEVLSLLIMDVIPKFNHVYVFSYSLFILFNTIVSDPSY